MTVSLTTRMANGELLFTHNPTVNGPQFTQLHMDLINASDPTNASPALPYYVWAAANNISVVIGDAGLGTYYGVPKNSPAGTPISMVIDSGDFTHVSNPASSAAPNRAEQDQLSSAAHVVLRGVHEIAHGRDRGLRVAG